MSLLYLLESLRCPVLDAFFSAVTLLGEETVFMALGLVFFWCVDKYRGYYLLSVGFVGTLLNQFLKIVCRVPRPWVRDPNFTIVESAREAATGYSFPSGHTQVAVGLYGGLARSTQGRTLRALCTVAAILVPLSRLYLGVHTPLDVGVSAILAAFLVFALYPIFEGGEKKPKRLYITFAVLTALTLAYLLFVELYIFPADTDPHNLAEAQKNGYTLFGCMVGLFLTYFVDQKYTHFPTKAVLWVQIFKLVVGLALVLLVKEGLREPLDALLGGHLAARSVRYFLTVLVGGVLWPLGFQRLSVISNKEKKHEA